MASKKKVRRITGPPMKVTVPIYKATVTVPIYKATVPVLTTRGKVAAKLKARGKRKKA